MWSIVQYKRIGKDVDREWQQQATQRNNTSRNLLRGIQQSDETLRNPDPEQHAFEQMNKENDKEGSTRQDGKVIVELNGDNDPLDPHNWPLLKKVNTLLILCLLVFTQAWAGACDSQANSKASLRYHVSPVAQNLSTAMYLFGIGSGCLFVGPLSQTLGRNPVYLGFTFAYLFFIMGTALSKNYASQVVCRYLAGLASSAALGINGASVGDMFRPVERALWFPVMAWVNVVRKYNSPPYIIEWNLIFTSSGPGPDCGRLGCLTR
jgi:hypothetical protein